MKFDEDGWLYKSSANNEIHYINNNDIESLLELGLEEDEWKKRVRYEVEHRDEVDAKLSSRQSFYLDEIRMRNTKGTILHYPFGKRIITFESTRHLYRGENQIYPKSQPSLNRKLEGMSNQDKEIYRAIANLRVIRFREFIWNFNIVPFWEAKMSDVNYKALAQHYGLETSLLDLTNDFRVALFFATCKYNSITDSYRPLTKDEIEQNENTKYGVIYHSPNWILDFWSGFSSGDFWYECMENQKVETYEIDSGKFDNIAFQIGYQPFIRCDKQSGYALPARNSKPLGEDNRFEKLYFKQSAELSQKVYEMMDGGKKVFPEEGISSAKKYIDEIKNGTVFTLEDIEEVYEYEVDKSIFHNIVEFKEALCSFEVNGKNIKIVDDDIKYNIDANTLKVINDYYNNTNLLNKVGGVIFSKREDREYMKRKCIAIYGKEI